MLIHDNRIGNSLTVSLEGRLDTVSSPELEAFLRKNFPSLTALIFDFEKLEYMSSAGLRVMLIAQKAMMDRGGIVIRGASKLVRGVFQVTGMEGIFRFE